MTIKILATAAVVAAVTLVTATTGFAKGHDQGFGLQLAGPATAGHVDELQTNRGGNGSATSYGKTDASVEAKLGEQDNSEVARDRASPGHPSN